MLFNSPIYIFVFLPLVLIVYLLLLGFKQSSLSKLWLVLASLFFYGYWNPVYLFLLTGSLLINFGIGRALQTTYSQGKSPYRKKLTTAGIIFNVALLGYFKYADFFLQNLAKMTGQEIEILNIALPLAISFFTFQQIAFLIDSYKEKTRTYSLLDYALFVCFFPQLIAGPIVHHKQMMPQFLRHSHSNLKINTIALGLTLFFIGLFKKVVIADTFAVWANAGFSNAESLNFFEAWGASLSYTFQLYYDFSGYSDMAIGAALLFNIKLPINFNSPYKATSIQDFWRRWHITLSHWLRDYVYIPLGGNKKGSFITYQNLLITFLIGGLWHGAGWTFVIWGALHGIALAAHRLWQNLNITIPAPLAWMITFLFINASWVFFRSESVRDAYLILTAMIDFNSLMISPEFKILLEYLSPLPLSALQATASDTFLSVQLLIMLLTFGVAACIAPNSLELVRYIPYKGKIQFRMSFLSGLSLAFITFISLLTFVGDTSPAEFLYFNF